MKKITLLTALLFAFSGIFAQNSKNWSSLEKTKLKLVKFCKATNDDGEIVKTGSMYNGDWLEYFYLYDDGRLILEKMAGTERYHASYDGATLDIDHGRGDLEWLQVHRRDGDRVVLWCSDGYLRYCKIVAHDENFINISGKKLKIDMSCDGENEHGHINRSGNISRLSNSSTYLYVKDSHRVDIIQDDEIVAKYRGYIDGTSFNIDEVIEGPSKKFFQIIDRCDDKYTIWCSDSKIRYCRVVDDDDSDDDDDDEDFDW